MVELTCIIPAYNEAESLLHLWPRLADALHRTASWEAMIIDDGSTDGTWPVIERLSLADKRCQGIRLKTNQGKSAALMAGFQAATGTIVVTMDADLQDEPQEIPKLIEPIRRGEADVVGGWKQDRQDPAVKRISSKIFNSLANRVAQTGFHDLNCGLKAYRLEVVKDLDLYGDLYRFIPVLASAQGWRVMELPVQHHAREYGQSKYGLRLGGIFDLVTLGLITKYRWRPLHFFGSWGALFFLFGLASLVYLTVVHFQGHPINDRPLLLFGILMIITGLQLFFTGLLADLILHHQSRRK
ncbi:MAG: glycosyltransferase family 2 protein [Candidatus Kerfeldbacteria bacterium]|nr:glycosyltransferase family 2 protein [Candidatus Kerfeldbacteria bacterium]